MTTTMSREAVDAKQTRGKIITIGCLFVAAVAIVIGAQWLDQMPPEPNYTGYYDGPWVNKQGELVSKDGVIQRHIYTGPQVLKQRYLP